MDPTPAALTLMPAQRERRVNIRVLLVEDNVTNQQVALGILRKLGFRSEAVANGREALDALRSIPYDLVLMDVQMPEMDGLEATRAARSPRSGVLNPRIPIIAMTAHAIRGDREDCIDAGMNDYMSKPVTPPALAEMLDKWAARLESVRVRGRAPSIDNVPAVAVELEASAAPKIFDETSLLARVMGDLELARTVAHGFLADIPKQIEALRRHLRAADRDGFIRQAHTIKSAAATVGGERLALRALALERVVGEDDVERVTDELTTEFEQLKSAMNASALLSGSGEQRR